MMNTKEQATNIASIRHEEITKLRSDLADRDAEIEKLQQRPEVTFEQDGWIEIEWHSDSHNLFSLSISRSGEVACAGISDSRADTCCDKITPAVYNAISEFIHDDEDQDS